MEEKSYNKKFSIAHFDGCSDDNIFLECFTNSSEQYKNEIFDIYFGTTFLHQDVTYGETMGTKASPAQYKNLLKIQEKFGVPISLTLNEMVRPIELIRTDVIKEFISFIKKYYDDGVRSCTISHVHLMRTGALQDAFPDMNWKNTVNHRITSTQEFIDYANLGYTIVQLDRNYNRNLNELKRTKKEADRLGVKTCLLITESCMPECPMKTEHDVWQGGKELRNLNKSYWDVAGHLSCSTWRKASNAMEETVRNPRSATDLMMHSREDWDDFASNVDVFKRSGRLYIPKESNLQKELGYFFDLAGEFVGVDSFETIYENNLSPMFIWFTYNVDDGDPPSPISVITDDIEPIKKKLENHFWNGEEAKSLCKTLLRCKNQCYSCHKCDDLFNTGKIDSILTWNREGTQQTQYHESDI